MCVVMSHFFIRIGIWQCCVLPSCSVCDHSYHESAAFVLPPPTASTRLALNLRLYVPVAAGCSIPLRCSCAAAAWVQATETCAMP
jgi:hypothetical protein